MAYVTVDVDIDLDEIDTDDLVDEICARLKRTGCRKSLSDKKKKELRDAIIQLDQYLSVSPVGSIEIKTLDDKMKFEYLAKVFDKYSSLDLEKLLP